MVFTYMGQMGEVFAIEDKEWESFSEDIVLFPAEKRERTIEFNHNVKVNSVNEDTIYIRDKNNQEFSVEYKVEGPIVKLIPLNDYSYDSIYTLYIDDRVQSETGKKLTKPIKMDFIIKKTVIEKPTEEIVEDGERAIVYGKNGFVEAVNRPHINIIEIAEAFTLEEGLNSIEQDIIIGQGIDNITIDFNNSQVSSLYVYGSNNVIKNTNIESLIIEKGVENIVLDNIRDKKDSQHIFNGGGANSIWLSGDTKFEGNIKITAGEDIRIFSEPEEEDGDGNGENGDDEGDTQARIQGQVWIETDKKVIIDVDISELVINSTNDRIYINKKVDKLIVTNKATIILGEDVEIPEIEAVLDVKVELKKEKDGELIEIEDEDGEPIEPEIIYRLNSSELERLLEEAKNYYNNTEEGDRNGQIPPSKRAKLNKVIEEAEELLNSFDNDEEQDDGQDGEDNGDEEDLGDNGEDEDQNNGEDEGQNNGEDEGQNNGEDEDQNNGEDEDQNNGEDEDQNGNEEDEGNNGEEVEDKIINEKNQRLIDEQVIKLKEAIEEFINAIIKVDRSGLLEQISRAEGIIELDKYQDFYKELLEEPLESVVMAARKWYNKYDVTQIEIDNQARGLKEYIDSIFAIEEGRLTFTIKGYKGILREESLTLYQRMKSQWHSEPMEDYTISEKPNGDIIIDINYKGVSEQEDYYIIIKLYGDKNKYLFIEKISLEDSPSNNIEIEIDDSFVPLQIDIPTDDKILYKNIKLYYFIDEDGEEVLANSFNADFKIPWGKYNFQLTATTENDSYVLSKEKVDIDGENNILTFKEDDLAKIDVKLIEQVMPFNYEIVNIVPLPIQYKTALAPRFVKASKSIYISQDDYKYIFPLLVAEKNNKFLQYQIMITSDHGDSLSIEENMTIEIKDNFKVDIDWDTGGGQEGETPSIDIEQKLSNYIKNGNGQGEIVAVDPVDNSDLKQRISRIWRVQPIVTPSGRSYKETGLVNGKIIVKDSNGNSYDKKVFEFNFGDISIEEIIEGEDITGKLTIEFHIDDDDGGSIPIFIEPSSIEVKVEEDED